MCGISDKDNKKCVTIITRRPHPSSLPKGEGVLVPIKQSQAVRPPFFPLSPDFQQLSAIWKNQTCNIPQRVNRFISAIILHMHKLVVLYVCVALLAGCSSAPYKAHQDTSASVSGVRIDLSDEHKVKQILKQQYDDWRNVKHRMGGMSKKGIDCSGLVYQTYRTKLGVELPRSTENQSKIGMAVKQDQLRAGDLVFFKTGIFSRHVGMYIDEGEFLHVSSRNGVMVSNLEDSYWRRAYWKARRVQ